MRIFVILLVLCFVFLQPSGKREQTDLEHDGFVGSVKKVFEQWSPVTNSWEDIRPGTRCRKATRIYDAAGRLVQSSVYPGSCGSDEIRDHFTYDKGGNRIRRSEEILGKGSNPPPPQMAPPGASQEQGEPKDVFKYDSHGRLAEIATQQPSGKIIFKVIHSYDEQGRLVETKRLDSNGSLWTRYTYSYGGHSRFPSASVNYDSADKVRSRVSYSDYSLNSQGDWVKRKETEQDDDGTVRVAIIYRTIEYHKAGK
jgi:hypothetical protein